MRDKKEENSVSDNSTGNADRKVDSRGATPDRDFRRKLKTPSTKLHTRPDTDVAEAVVVEEAVVMQLEVMEVDEDEDEEDDEEGEEDV